MMITINRDFLCTLEDKLHQLGDYQFVYDQSLVDIIVEFLSYYASDVQVACEDGYELLVLKEITEESKQAKREAYRKSMHDDIEEVSKSLSLSLNLDAFIEKIKNNYFGIEQDQEIQTLFLLIAIKEDLEAQKKLFQEYLKENVITPLYIDSAKKEVNSEPPAKPVFPDFMTNSMMPPYFFPMFDGGMPFLRNMTPAEKLTVDITKLEAKKAILEQEIKILEQTRDALKNNVDEMMITVNPTQYPDFLLLDTARRVPQPRLLSFSHIVLSTFMNEVSKPLPILQGKLERSQNRGDYYRQFMPYILSEIKENVEKQKQTIAKKSLHPFRVQLSDGDLSENQHDDLLHIDVTMKNKDLPKLDHGFFRELVMIVIPEQGPNDFKRKSKKVLENLSIYAIAQAHRHTEDDDNDDEREKKITLKIEIARADFQQITSRKIRAFDVHWLVGLIPSERMYLACQHPPHVSFESQYLYAELPAWPAAGSNIVATPSVRALNPKQQEKVLQLASAEEGLYLLQGPPGTGKTTTAAALITQLIKQHPDKTLLVCTPSNQSLRELLTRVYALSSEASMALIGVGKNLPKALDRIYVSHYAYSLYQPLIELKRDLQSLHLNKEIKAVVEKTCQELNQAYQDLSYLVTYARVGLEKDVIKDFKKRVIDPVLTIKHELSAIYLSDNSAIDKDYFSKDIEDAITHLQKNSYLIEGFLVQRAQIVFSTLVASGRPWLKKQRSNFDILIIDEAAQALIPEAIIPFKFSPQLCIQIGDPQQLPPTVVSRAAQESGFQNSMMFKLMRVYEQPYEMLSIQYRMHPEICRWISRQFYDNQLETATSVLRRPFLLQKNRYLPAELKKPSLFFHVPDGSEQRHGDEQSASIRNDAEARAIVVVTCNLLFTCHFRPEEIGIITFYAAQIVLIKQLFEEALRRRRLSPEDYKHYQKNLLINTVDGFQGGERPITLISCVRTSESVGFLNDERRLNVGFSRAQDARWVFGFFDSLNRSNSQLPSLLKDVPVEDVGQYFSY